MSTFVPARRTTRGTERLIVLAALTTPLAIVSHFMIPPKIFTRIALTGSAGCGKLEPAPRWRFLQHPRNQEIRHSSCPWPPVQLHQGNRCFR
eukprot:29075_4